MSYELPKRKHLVHKAIEPRNLSAAKAAAALARTDDLWQVKYDGDHVILLKVNGHAYAFSRQGGEVAGAMDRQLRAMEALATDNYVLFAEAWRPDDLHSTIDGNFRRGYVDGDRRTLQAIVFDMVPLGNFDLGTYAMCYEDRLKGFDELLFALRTFGHGHIFDKAFTANSRDECAAFVEHRKAEGDLFEIDGFMRKARLGSWIAGGGSDGYNIKDKEVLSVDLKVEGLIEGKGKFVGMLGAYECTYKGQPQLVGGGKLTDKQRKAIWENHQTPDGGIGSIIEVHALGESTNGLLREPRYHRTRRDKTEGE